MTIEIIHKEITVTVENIKEISIKDVIKIISETIDKINTTCKNE